jgi:hypothetical protein
MHLTHSPTIFYKAVANFKDSQPHVDAIKSIGFGGLLQMPNVTLRKQMILDILKAYDTREQGLMILGQLVRVSLDDVHHIMGLETRGNNVTEHINSKPNSENETVDNELFKRFPCSDNHKLELAGLEDMLRKGRPLEEDFLRAFVLFTIGVIIASPTGSYISAKYIKVVRDVQQIRHFNWGQYTLNYLLEALVTFKHTGEKTLKGNLVLLQVSSLLYIILFKQCLFFDLLMCLFFK